MLSGNNEKDFSFDPSFEYKHLNPYHERLKSYEQFVLRDKEGEEFRGQWASKCFGNHQPIDVEIGSGYGHFMQEYSQNNPERSFLGMDYRFKRSYDLAKKLDKIAVKNFRYLRAKGERLTFLFEKNEVDRIFYFFPDPWPKRRHHKKRLFQKMFLKAALEVLKPNGMFFIKTDHQGYYEWMNLAIEQFPNESDKFFSIEFNEANIYQSKQENLLTRYQTKFEKIFLQKNIPIKGIILKCNLAN